MLIFSAIVLLVFGSLIGLVYWLVPEEEDHAAAMAKLDAEFAARREEDRKGMSFLRQLPGFDWRLEQSAIEDEAQVSAAFWRRQTEIQAVIAAGLARIRIEEQAREALDAPVFSAELKPITPVRRNYDKASDSV